MNPHLPIIGLGSKNQTGFSFNFTGGVLDPRITFTRSSVGSYFDTSGVLQLASTNSARFDYDPVTLQPRGLLIEEQRTNLLTYSEQFTDASWVVNGSPVITADQTTAPDGTMTADTIAVSGASNGFGVYRYVVSSGTYASSIYFKLMSGAFTLRLGLTNNFSEINCSTLAITNTGTGVGSVTAVGNGWYRFVSVGTVSALSASQIYNIGSNTGTLAVWGAQLEAGAFPTSYIPTAGSTVTRAADDASMTGTNFSSWYATDNTIVVEASSPASGTRIIWQADDGTANNRATLYTSGTSLKLDIVTGGVSQASLTLGTIFANTAFKAAFALKTNDVAASLNGAAQVTDTSVTLPTVDRCRFGSDTTGNQLCEHIKSFTSYASRLADVQGLAA